MKDKAAKIISVITIAPVMAFLSKAQYIQYKL